MTALASNKRQFKCPVCERTVERKSRTQAYCSAKCMRKGNRAVEKLAAEALKTPPRYPYSGDVRTPYKSSNENNVLQWPQTGSSLSANGPINLLGGGSWKWPGAGHVDIKTISKVRWCEVGGELMDPPE